MYSFTEATGCLRSPYSFCYDNSYNKYVSIAQNCICHTIKGVGEREEGGGGGGGGRERERERERELELKNFSSIMSI